MADLLTMGLNVLLHGLAAAPAIEEDLRAAFSAHWGKDHVQQAVQGVQFLSKLVNDVASALQAEPSVAAQPEPAPAPQPAGPPAAQPVPLPARPASLPTGPVVNGVVTDPAPPADLPTAQPVPLPARPASLPTGPVVQVTVAAPRPLI